MFEQKLKNVCNLYLWIIVDDRILLAKQFQKSLIDGADCLWAVAVKDSSWEKSKLHFWS